MSYSEYQFRYTKEYYELKNLYESIDKAINILSNSEINLNPIKFDSFQGDVTKGIKWIWAGNQQTLDYFTNFFESINLGEKLTNRSSNKFIIRGASFITLNQSQVIDSSFHLDAMSQYDTKSANILTILFPLYEIEEGMGHLEYKNNGDIEVYTYKTDNIIVWDSCKFLHRTQPYSIPKSKTRVLVSINLTTDELWAINTLKNCLNSQGAKFLVLE